jgi:hypothetical protein
MVILWAVLWRLNDEPASLQFDLMMVLYLGRPGIAYYWRKPDAHREKNQKKKSTHSFSGDEARRSQSRISRHFDMIPYD